jgi:hypothetical protein
VNRQQLATEYLITWIVKANGRENKSLRIENGVLRINDEYSEQLCQIFGVLILNPKFAILNRTNCLWRSEMDGTVKEKGVGYPFVTSVIPDVDPC